MSDRSRLDIRDQDVESPRLAHGDKSDSDLSENTTLSQAPAQRSLGKTVNVSQYISTRSRRLSVITAHACATCRRKRAKVCRLPRSGAVSIELANHLLHSVMDNRLADAAIVRIPSVSTKPLCATRKTIFVRNSTACACANGCSNVCLRRSFIRHIGKRLWHAYGAANSRSPNGSTLSGHRTAASYHPIQQALRLPGLDVIASLQ